MLYLDGCLAANADSVGLSQLALMFLLFAKAAKDEADLDKSLRSVDCFLLLKIDFIRLELLFDAKLLLKSMLSVTCLVLFALFLLFACSLLLLSDLFERRGLPVEQLNMRSSAIQRCCLLGVM